ncbi:hypothetical protein B0T20DRAFT_482803 [Sordaria brevicollis]|uniref:Uncharacterized protein n=1 Tax=Sordaria brevicollis TaxID=83679 RepID=A0AAE0P3I3_SORBR|nr:hypothetical protein B0T20DRAFT_482803 [Sordaria brevicollis]
MSTFTTTTASSLIDFLDRGQDTDCDCWSTCSCATTEILSPVLCDFEDDLAFDYEPERALREDDFLDDVEEVERQIVAAPSDRDLASSAAVCDVDRDDDDYHDDDDIHYVTPTVISPLSMRDHDDLSSTENAPSIDYTRDITPRFTAKLEYWLPPSLPPFEFDNDDLEDFETEEEAVTTAIALTRDPALTFSPETFESTFTRPLTPLPLPHEVTPQKNYHYRDEIAQQEWLELPPSEWLPPSLPPYEFDNDDLEEFETEEEAVTTAIALARDSTLTFSPETFESTFTRPLTPLPLPYEVAPLNTHESAHQEWLVSETWKNLQLPPAGWLPPSLPAFDFGDEELEQFEPGWVTSESLQDLEFPPTGWLHLPLPAYEFTDDEIEPIPAQMTNLNLVQ